jgi:hypothetical protein
MPQWEGAQTDCVHDKARYRTFSGGLARWDGLRGCGFGADPPMNLRRPNQHPGTILTGSRNTLPATRP